MYISHVSCIIIDFWVCRAQFGLVRVCAIVCAGAIGALFAGEKTMLRVSGDRSLCRHEGLAHFSFKWYTNA